MTPFAHAPTVPHVHPEQLALVAGLLAVGPALLLLARVRIRRLMARIRSTWKSS